MKMAIKIRSIIGLFIAILISTISFAQEDGIHFETGKSWSDIKSKAKKENKYIFIDCFTTWCAPCKYMSRDIFPRKKVGDYFNSHFISVAVQMDQTLHDSETVKRWYGQAKMFETAYSITAYPTYLFFSPDGLIVHRMVGGFKEDDFISKAGDALIPEKQYYNLINNYKDHTADSVFLHDALSAALKGYDKLNASAIAGFYINCVKDPFTKDQLELIRQSCQSDSDKVFLFLLCNAPRIDSVFNNRDLESDLIWIIANDEIDPLFAIKDTVLNMKKIVSNLQIKYPTLGQPLLNFTEGRFQADIGTFIMKEVTKNEPQKPDWKKLLKTLNMKFPGCDCRKFIAEKKPGYLAFKKQWTECGKYAVALLREYGDVLDAGQINDIVWYYVFMHCSDPVILEEALKWSKRSVEREPEASNDLDTYANLLYKLGDLETALVWEKKAIEKCEMIHNNPGELKILNETLEKMLKKEKTWKESSLE